jgi:hypothetical protein
MFLSAAGPAAEYLLDPTADFSKYASGDRENILKHAHIEQTDAQWEKLVMLTAEELLPVWLQITRVAVALLGHKTLDANQIQMAIGWDGESSMSRQ